MHNVKYFGEFINSTISVISKSLSVSCFGAIDIVYVIGLVVLQFF